MFVKKLPLEQPFRVVVTGLGLVSPLGVGAEYVWKKLINGERAIQRITQFDVTDLPCKVAAQVKRSPKCTPDSKQQMKISCSSPIVDVSSKQKPFSVDEENWFDANQWMPKGLIGSSVSPFMEFAFSAAHQAIEDSRWKPTEEKDLERTGVAIGSGIGNLDEIGEVYSLLREKGYRKISPYFIPKILINLAGGHISIRYGFKGPNHSAVTACATGSHSIGDAFRMIRHGEADVMVAGGTEACISPLCIAGFSRMKALSTKYNETPEFASRPFDRDRDGFVPGEGAGVIVLEEYEHALRRGAKIYAELSGYGLSGDAYHITSPNANGNGALRAMKMALKQANFSSKDIDYINAHATSTPLGDLVESEAIKALFQEEGESSMANLSVSSTKGAIGHLLGAAGAVEAIFTILSILNDTLPPTMNLYNLEPQFDLPDYVPLKAKRKSVKVALSNSFGFGGTNVSLLFQKATIA